jgi:hypothetical protein
MHTADLFALSRRRFLWNAGGGIAGVALSQLLAREAGAFGPGLPRGLHHPAKVQRVIQLFMNGGTSQMDTFDYKPALAKFHGQMLARK